MTGHDEAKRVPNLENQPPVASPTSLRTRREVLVAGMAGAFSMALAACGGETARKAASIAPAGSDLGAVEHVIFLMNENRSFDHYFGSYKGVRGFDDPAARSARASSPRRGRGVPAKQLLPFHLDTANTDAECTFDLSHEWSAQHTCWNGGPDGPASSPPTPRRSARGLRTACSRWATTPARISTSGTRSPTPSPSATAITARSWGRRTRTGSTPCRERSTPKATKVGR